MPHPSPAPGSRRVGPCLAALLLLAGTALGGCKNGHLDDPAEEQQEPNNPDNPDDPNPPRDHFFGTAVGSASDTAADDFDFPQFSTYFRQVTPENGGKWGSVEAAQDTMTWDASDAAYTFARANGLAFKFHTLVWGQQQPAWLDGLSTTDQRAQIEQWMDAVAARYPDADLIDVVNEALPGHAQPSYKQALGGDGASGWDWVVTAFKMARQRWPDAKLILNDYHLLDLGQFTDQYLTIVKALQDAEEADGVKLLDGIGEQGHFLESAELSVIRANLKKLTDTGVPVYISELDVSIVDDAQQANRFKDLFTMFWENPNVKGVTHWGYRQGVMWRGSGYLLKSDGTPRPSLVWLGCVLSGGTDCTVPEYAPRPRAGDDFNVRLEAEECDANHGVAADSQVAYTDDGDWLEFRNVVVKPGYDTVRVRYTKGNDPVGRVTLHLDSLDAPAVAEVSFANSGGWNNWTEASAALTPGSATPPGGHTLYVKFHDGDGGVANLDWIELGKPLRQGDETKLEIAATSHDQAFGVTDQPAPSAVTPTAAGAYVAYANVVVGKYTILTADYARSSGDTGVVHVHKNAVDGPVVASFAAPATGGGMGSVSAVLDLGPGTVNLFFVFGEAGMGAFQRFTLVRSELGPNLVANSGFETGTGGWATWSSTATLSSSATLAHGGTRSLLIGNRTALGDNAVYGLTGSVVPGVPYAASAWVSLQGATAAQEVKLTAKIACQGSADAYVTLASNAAVDATAGVWTKLDGTLQVPSSCTQLNEVAIYVEGAAGAPGLFVDDVAVQQELGQNIVGNPDFESGQATGWSTWIGSLAVTGLVAHGGTYSLMTAPGGNAVYNLTSAVEAGKSYPVSLWVTVGQDEGTAPDANVNVTAKIQCGTAAASYGWIVNPVKVTAGVWTQLTGTLSIDASCSPTEVSIYPEGVSAPVRLFIDDVVVTGG